MAKSTYESKAEVTSIRATSRASVKVNDAYYTLEYSEERIIPNVKGIDVDKERALLWDTVNSECDKQIEDVLKTFKK
jgi:hypothetical protein